MQLGSYQVHQNSKSHQQIQQSYENTDLNQRSIANSDEPLEQYWRCTEQTINITSEIHNKKRIAKRLKTLTTLGTLPVLVFCWIWKVSLPYWEKPRSTYSIAQHIGDTTSSQLLEGLLLLIYLSVEKRRPAIHAEKMFLST